MKFIVLFSIAVQFANAQQATLISPLQLEAKLKSSNSSLTVVNFWATWCGPCIKELPYFQEAHGKNDVSVLLVSMDYTDEREKVLKFIQKKKIETPVVQLDVKDYDAFMTSIHKDWSGAIPATLFIDSNGKRYFHEGAFTQEALNSTIAKYLKTVN